MSTGLFCILFSCPSDVFSIVHCPKEQTIEVPCLEHLSVSGIWDLVLTFHLSINMVSLVKVSPAISSTQECHVCSSLGSWEWSRSLWVFSVILWHHILLKAVHQSCHCHWIQPGPCTLLEGAYHHVENHFILSSLQPPNGLVFYFCMFPESFYLTSCFWSFKRSKCLRNCQRLGLYKSPLFWSVSYLCRGNFCKNPYSGTEDVFITVSPDPVVNKIFLHLSGSLFCIILFLFLCYAHNTCQFFFKSESINKQRKMRRTTTKRKNRAE